ncbi:hypothetical protein MTR67_032521 [Solanum verrucosum]|uniref:Uncharacterized protein n=1 Tax=Solanum verrucosum TaxID=315347 RepID=A0AAF0ZFR0_SOLVR|nr:hypothetical protein MTR67_032521 [Solanum verrucosum]
MPMSDNEHDPDVEAETEAATQEFEPYGPDVENEEDPHLRSMVICESELRAEKLKRRVVPTGARKIQFYGDHIGASVPTNLPYSLIKQHEMAKKLSLMDMCRCRQKTKEPRSWGLRDNLLWT